MKKLWFGLCAITLLLTGCRSVSVLSFDVWRPAKITFPVEIERVTVVNNSEDPDERIGNRYEDISNREYTLVVPHDSTSYRLAEYIAVALSDAHYFPEIFAVSHDCRFNNCTHRNEPGCAVLKALEEHYISESRYASYLSIIEDHEDGKYRTGY